MEVLKTQIDNLQQEILRKDQTIQSQIDNFDPFKRMSKLTIQQVQNTIIPSVLPNNYALQQSGQRGQPY